MGVPASRHAGDVLDEDEFRFEGADEAEELHEEAVSVVGGGRVLLVGGERLAGSASSEQAHCTRSPEWGELRVVRGDTANVAFDDGGVGEVVAVRGGCVGVGVDGDGRRDACLREP